MLLSLLLATLMNAHAREPLPVADRVRPASACSALLDLVNARVGIDRTEDAWSLEREFAQLYLPIPSDIERSALGTMRVMSSRGGKADALASARRLYALQSREHVEGDVSNVLDYLSELQDIVKGYNEKDAKQTRRAVRAYALIPLAGVSIVGASFVIPQTGLLIAGAAVALLPLRNILATVRSFRNHLEDATALIGQVGLNPKAREWVHVHAVTGLGEVVDILVFATESGEPRLASFVSL